MESSSLWQELEKRKAAAKLHGGERTVQRQTQNGKLIARARIERLVDKGKEGSQPEAGGKLAFQEIGSASGFSKYKKSDQGHTNNLLHFQSSNTIGGYATISGKNTVIFVDDFTHKGSHADGGHWQKLVFLAQQALRYRVPFIQLLDGASGGGSVGMLFDHPHASYLPPLPGFEALIKLRNQAPVISILLGPVVGIGAARSQLGHLVIMCEPIAQLFVAGPPLVAEAFHQKISKEALGGANTIKKSGTVDLLAGSEDEAYEMCRVFLSYTVECASVRLGDAVIRAEKISLPENRREVYDIRTDVIDRLVDHQDSKRSTSYPFCRNSSFFEIGRSWGQEAVTGFARVGGYKVGIISFDCAMNAGALSSSACRKITRFVSLCTQFSIPLVSLVDQPGFQIGPDSERAGTLRDAAEMMDSLYQFNLKERAPYLAVIIRRCFGVGGAAFVSCGGDGVTPRVAWPTGFWGSLPSRGGVQAAFRGKLQSLPDDQSRRDAVDKISNQLEVLSSPVRSAERFLVEEIILPESTPKFIADTISRWNLGHKKNGTGGIHNSKL